MAQVDQSDLVSGGAVVSSGNTNNKPSPWEIAFKSAGKYLGEKGAGNPILSGTGWFINNLVDEPKKTTGAKASEDYGSMDMSGYDQANWALEQQWKMDEREREFNSAEAQKQRDWEKMMSDTAITRAMNDIKAAGLNPWLALNGGSLGPASTPSGASASSSSGSSKVPQNYMAKLLVALVNSAAGILKAIA